jgi:hypothetical protein
MLSAPLVLSMGSSQQNLLLDLLDRRCTLCKPALL